MRLFTLTSCLLLTTVSAAWAQSFVIKGRVTDRVSGEALPGTSIGLEGSTLGGVTDGGGSFAIKGVAPGAYTLKVSYIGYVTAQQKVTITNHDETVAVRLAEDNTTLNEVEVVASVAVERETPVAFSAVNEVRLRESLAGRDLPLILNETPGVYATQSGGGAGDSRISIRGFDQRNVAVMINGVPVNDMENGQVYWSNWDLGDVTKNLQVQRGLTASKLAVPSVGGTINVFTKGFDAKRGGRVRQEVGFNNSRKTSLMLSSGKLPGDWAVTVFGSRRQGDGWVDALFDDAWTYFGTVSKRIGKHQLSLTGLGSPQSHGQRSFAQPIASFSHEKAAEAGVRGYKAITERGFRFNPHWDNVDRYTRTRDGVRGPSNVSVVNERTNYYHKPQVNLNHLWTVTDKLFISNVAYASFGRGGGVGPNVTLDINSATGRFDLQKVYDNNVANYEPLRGFRKRVNGQNVDTVVRDDERLSGRYLRSSVNNHKWYGFITSFDYKLNESTTLSAGLDGRYYRGEHYQKVYDLLGGDYALDNNVPAGSTPRRLTPTIVGTGDQLSLDPYRKLRVGDKVRYNYDGITTQGGGYGQAEYKAGPLAAFVSGTFSVVSYKRIDFFRAPRVVAPDGTVLRLGSAGLTQIPNTQDYYSAREQITVAKPSNYRYPTQNFASTDTTITVPYGTTATYNGRTYTAVAVDPAQQKAETTPWVRLPGFTLKTGFNYNLTEDNNLFFNIGVLSRAQFFNFVFTQAGDRVNNPKNENIFSTEIGYAINKGNFKASLNAYRTYWRNKSLSIGVVSPVTGETISSNVSGLDALHQGVELDLAQEITSQISINSAISIGDWRWNSAGEYRIIDQNNQEIGNGSFNPKGVHVGGSAQNQFMLGLRYEPLPGLFVRPTFTLFTKNYADFDPSTLRNDAPQDAFRLPTQRNVDLHTGYSHEVRVGGHGYRLAFNASMLNVFNQFFITDAPTGGATNPFDPTQTLVFYNLGRRVTGGVTIDF